MKWAAHICLAFFLLAVGLMEGDAAGASKLDTGLWKYSVPLVVRNQTQLPVSNAVTRVDIEIRDGMKPDLGDIRIVDAAGYEIPAMVADVREYFRFNLLFAVDLPAGGKRKYLLLYGNRNAERRDRLNLADTPLNCVPNPGFEEGARDDPRMPAGWNCRALPPGTGTGRTAENVCSGSWSMRIYAATNANSPWLEIFPPNVPLRKGEQMILALSIKAKNPSPKQGQMIGALIPKVTGIKFPQIDYEWMTRAKIFTVPAAPTRLAAPAPFGNPDAAPAKTDSPEDDVALLKIRLLVGAQWMQADSTLWFDDVFIGRYVDVEAEFQL